MLKNLRRLMNKFIFNKDFLVLSLNVSLSLTAFWGIFVCIIFSSLFSYFKLLVLRKKFIISALCNQKKIFIINSSALYSFVWVVSATNIFFFIQQKCKWKLNHGDNERWWWWLGISVIFVNYKFQMSSESFCGSFI